MKRATIKHVICLLAGYCTLVACKKYLDTPPDNQRIPVTVKDYTEMLNGEGWSRNIRTQGGASLFFLDMMTTDVEENIAPMSTLEEKGSYSAFYTWQNQYDAQYDERHAPSSIGNDTWLGLYRIIQVCNIITDADKNIKGDEPSRLFLMGEACFTRALAYYFLINIWGRPYDPVNAADPMGVPLKTNSTIEINYAPRSTVNTVYDQILADLTSAEQYVLASGKKGSVYHYSPAAIYLLLSRVHLYLQHWELAIAYANKCIQLNPVLYNISNQAFAHNAYYSTFFGAQNPEIFYTYYNNAAVPITDIFGNWSNYSFRISSALLQLYEPGDQRPGAYFSTYYATDSVFTPITFTPQSTYYCYSFRTAEAYLNRAEANAHLGETDKALRDINQLRSHRIKNAFLLAITDKEKLLQTILQERRKELAFQLHGWFDLRRTTLPEMTHYFTPVVKSKAQPRQRFILHKNDPGYTLEIPVKALQANPAIKPLGLKTRLPE